MAADADRRRRRRIAAGPCALALGLALALGACGSSSHSAQTTSQASAPSGGGQAVGAFAAKAAAATRATPPQFGGPTQPVSAPAHLKLAVVSCGQAIEGCTILTAAAQQAAASLGWDVRVFDGASDPTKMNAAFLDALSWGAQGIASVSIDANAVQQGLAAAKAKHVPAFSLGNGTDSPNPVVRPAAGKLGYAFDVALDYPSSGRAAADWIVADSRGKANVLVFQDKEFPGSMAQEGGLLDELKRCGGCTVQPVQQFTASTIGTTLATDTVAYVRNHPDVTYVWAAFDPAAVVQVNALAQAGLGGKVKLVSTVGNKQNIALIRSGRVQVADLAYDSTYLGYAGIDQFLRSLAGGALAQPVGEQTPFVVLDATNLPASGQDWTAPFDYKNAFARLWRAGR